ncbi:response regulator transcription factor [Paenibacillus luteus]|uniref:response regulator transcription factor n=1 Tax=Paenibacillus luteus TaxID=2545753 RepID=UPI001141C35F|nr:response regulator [Paenibacillus luteus]
MSTMISVMLVDDEPLALENVYEMVDWSAHGFTIVGQATNGRKALQIFEQWKPQIVITDISMSPMSGLELGAHIQQIAPETKLIFLTAYRDFDYARQAIELQAANYLLKHEISKDRLLNHLLEIKMRIETEGMDRDLALRLMIRNLLSGRFTSQDGHLLTQARKRLERQTGLLYWEFGSQVCADGSRIASHVPSETLGLIERAIEEQVEHVEEILIMEQELGHVVFLKLDVPNSQLIVQYSMQAVAYALQRLLGMHTGIEPSIIMGELANKDSQKLWMSMQEAYDFSLLQPPRALFLMEQVRQAASRNVSPFPSLKDLIQSEGQWAGLQTRLQAMLDTKNLSDLRELLNHLPAWTSLLHVPPEQTIGANAAEIVSVITELLSLKVKKSSQIGGYSRWVIKAMEKVRMHYADPDLTLDTVASMLQISSVHLRTTFKKETGQSLLEYTTDCRIRAAKKMLLEGDLKIYEIAERVGYKTSQYFSQVFKRSTGFHPKDYNGQESRG